MPPTSLRVKALLLLFAIKEKVAHGDIVNDWVYATPLGLSMAITPVTAPDGITTST
jgi:hypothetical protein